MTRPALWNPARPAALAIARDWFVKGMDADDVRQEALVETAAEGCGVRALAVSGLVAGVLVLNVTAGLAVGVLAAGWTVGCRLGERA